MGQLMFSLLCQNTGRALAIMLSFISVMNLNKRDTLVLICFIMKWQHNYPQSSNKFTWSWHTVSHPVGSLISWSLNKNKSWSNQLLNSWETPWIWKLFCTGKYRWMNWWCGSIMLSAQQQFLSVSTWLL